MDIGSGWRRRWRTRCCSRAAVSAAFLALAAGCNTNDPSPADARRSDVEDLGGDEENAPKLAAILLDLNEDELVRALAASQLGELDEGAKQGAALAAAVESDPSPIVRRDAIKACDTLKLRSAAPAVAGRLSDPDANVRRAAASALARIGDDGSVDALLAALDDRDLGVQELAAASLRQLTGQKFGRDAGAWREWGAGRKGP